MRSAGTVASCAGRILWRALDRGRRSPRSGPCAAPLRNAKRSCPVLPLSHPPAAACPVAPPVATAAVPGRHGFCVIAEQSAIRDLARRFARERLATLDHRFRAQHAFPPPQWMPGVHKYYGHAEQAGVAGVRVRQPTLPGEAGPSGVRKRTGLDVLGSGDKVLQQRDLRSTAVAPKEQIGSRVR